MSITWDNVMKFKIIDNPIIFDIGGFKGDWVKIAMDYYKNPTIYVFEPVNKFYNEIVERWKGYPNVKVYNFGLSNQNREETISIEGDSSSVFIKNGNTEKIKLRDIREFLFEEQIFNVHLAKINIEGEEYRLMEYLTSHPELNIFNNYLIQFHKFIDNYSERRNNIVQNLSKYYNRVFNYEFIFEGWEMKKIEKINCFGDSHISIFANTEKLIKENISHIHESFNVFRFGPYLAYNLLSKENVLKELKKINNYEKILICFGEIDCRSQVKRISEKTGNSYDEIINDIVEKYFYVIDKIGNKNIILFSVTPELKEKPHWYYYKDHPEVFDCPKGTLIERQNFKKYYNKRVEEESLKRGFEYISIFDYIYSDGVTKEIYFLDDIHLNPKKVMYLIKRSLLKSGLNKK